MKKVFVLSLAVIFGFALVMGCATMQTKDANEKEAVAMANSKGPKKKWIKIRIDFESGQVYEVKAHDPGGSEQELNQQQIDELLQGPHQYIGNLIYTHSSPGCVTYILGGRAIKICY